MIPVGKPGRRAELAEIALALRAEGALQREIAEILGIHRSYASALLNDPTGAGDRARKDRYRKPCPSCGALMDGSAGRNGKGSKLCRACDAVERPHAAVWTREALIEAIRAYAAKYGHPPGAMDWNPGMARSNGRGDKAERFYEDGWPSWSLVQTKFGSWNRGIAAAGFTPLRSGHKYSDRAYRERAAS